MKRLITFKNISKQQKKSIKHAHIITNKSLYDKEQSPTVLR